VITPGKSCCELLRELCVNGNMRTCVCEMSTCVCVVSALCSDASMHCLWVRCAFSLTVFVL
jgi:hypothetical protein